MGSMEEGVFKRILITGAAGFIGQALAAALIKDGHVEKMVLTDVVAPPALDTLQKVNKSSMCESIAADLTDKATCERLFSNDFTHVYLLHGIMSGAAEENLELGLRVNLDSMRHVVDALRSKVTDRPTRVIFPSSLAVFGPMADGGVVTEKTMPLPHSSYGTQKAMTEILLNDFSRRHLLDARIVRLPTIIVRPGKPTGAASSFCSGIIREPLRGEKTILPVGKSLRLWVCSARTVVKNLVTAGNISEAKFTGSSRVVNLPGIMVTVEEMLSALGQVGGDSTLNLVEEAYDEKVANIVGSWPSVFDTAHARKLGFSEDVPLNQAVQDYVTDYM